jgi:diguanylate cyclase (GGDEF)-like protein
MTELADVALSDRPARWDEELATLVEIGKALTSSLNLKEVLDVIMGKVGALLKPKLWSLLLVDRESDELYFEIVVSPVAEQLKQVRLKIGEGIAGWVALHGEPLLIADAQSDDRFARQIDQQVDFSTHSLICVPLMVRGQVLGVIELVNSLEDKEYGEPELHIIAMIADYAAIAIDNARNYQRVYELVITDDLTGLYNSRHFNTLLEREVEAAKRFGHPLSMVFLDLDRFKLVNDTYGHLVGSRVLSEMGALIKRNVRVVDYAARFGGDEYVLLLPNTSKSGALTLVKKLREVMRTQLFRADDGREFQVTASFGIATYPDDAASNLDLVRLADEAMYAVKGGGRDGIRAANSP